MRIWTPEQRKVASDRMKSRWANPITREELTSAICKDALCIKCGEKDVNNFYQDKNGRRTNALCKSCHKINSMARWHSMTPEVKQSTRVHSMYGLTPEKYLEMHRSQDGKCAICNERPKTIRGLHVDHCHKSNRVRGLLCHGCNTGIGALKESQRILMNAIKYIEDK